MFKKIASSANQLYKNSKNELTETKEATKILWAARKRKLSAEEKTELTGQSQDVLRLVFLTVLFIIPFSGIFIILLVKGGEKVGVRFLPSSFVKQKHDITRIKEQGKTDWS